MMHLQNGRKEVNVELKKEAEFFSDIVIVPYMDHYDLVVLKTVAICEYGVSTELHSFKSRLNIPASRVPHVRKFLLFRFVQQLQSIS